MEAGWACYQLIQINDRDRLLESLRFTASISILPRSLEKLVLYVYVCSILTMHSKEIIARLKREGWKKVGGKGDHEKFKHADKQGHVVVPHPRKDMPKGTLKSIFRQAGWA